MAELYEGGVFMHPRHGPIYVTDGNYMIDGRISNFWYWRKIKPDGSLSRRRLYGYGRDWPEIYGAKVEITVRLP